jgi:hypothetical protein
MQTIGLAGNNALILLLEIWKGILVKLIEVIGPSFYIRKCDSSLFSHTIDLKDGSKTTIKVDQSTCGKGVVVCHENVSADGKTRSVSCSGTRPGGSIS